jgi:hypothetical protein
MYDVQKPECTLVFTEPKPAHDEVIKRILYQHAQQHAHRGEGGAGAGEGGEGDEDAGRDSDADLSKLDVTMREEPDDDRAAEDNARIDDILASPDMN